MLELDLKRHKEVAQNFI